MPSTETLPPVTAFCPGGTETRLRRPSSGPDAAASGLGAPREVRTPPPELPHHQLWGPGYVFFKDRLLHSTRILYFRSLHKRFRYVISSYAKRSAATGRVYETHLRWENREAKGCGGPK